MATKRDRQVVSLPAPTMEKARELSLLASRYGWAALGADREDLPTMVAIIDEAINVLAARAKPKGKK